MNATLETTITRNTWIEYTFTIEDADEYRELNDALEYPLYYYTESAAPQFGYMQMREDEKQETEQFFARQQLKRDIAKRRLGLI